jgi:flagellar hook-basal body complex protein FliE
LLVAGKDRSHTLTSNQKPATQQPRFMDPISNSLNVGKSLGAALTPAKTGQAGAGGASFADTLKQSIDEVSKMQQDASQAVEDLASGKTENVSGVMTAMEKSDLAFKTLLAIRSKLMDAYEEIKNIPI